MQPLLRKLKLREVKKLAQHHPEIIVRLESRLSDSKAAVLSTVGFCLQYRMFT